MNKRKRSKSINLNAMRKPASYSVMITGSIVLSGCSEDAEWYETVDQCIADTDCVEFCKAAYQQAVSEAKASAPRYSSLDSCEYDFGKFGCDQYSSSYTPNMAGFLVAEDLDCDSRYRSGSYYGRSLFWPRGRGAYSKSKGKLVTAKGEILGSAYTKSFKVDSATFKSRASSYKTMRRGGFGQTVRSSSFSSKSSSWGG